MKQSILVDSLPPPARRSKATTIGVGALSTPYFVQLVLQGSRSGHAVGFQALAAERLPGVPELCLCICFFPPGYRSRLRLLGPYSQAAQMHEYVWTISSSILHRRLPRRRTYISFQQPARLGLVSRQGLDGLL